MRKYYFYLVKENFVNVFKGDAINVLMLLMLRKNENEINKTQINNIIDIIKLNEINEALNLHFSQRKDYSNNGDNHLMLNRYTGKRDILKVNSEHLILECENEISPFVNMLSLYYPNLIIVNYAQNKIHFINNAKEILCS